MGIFLDPEECLWQWQLDEWKLEKKFSMCVSCSSIRDSIFIFISNSAIE